MPGIKTSGDFRGFLTDIMIGIRDGTVEADDANAIARVASQVNQSLAVEVKAAVELQRLGKDASPAGAMQIADSGSTSPAIAQDVWCEQCDKRVSKDAAEACGDRFCKARAA